MLLALKSKADVKYLPLAELADKVNVKTKYTLENDNLLVSLSKNTSADLYIIIPAGYHFDSDSQRRQDLLVVRSKKFIFKSDKMDVTLKGFCSQASKGSPQLNDTYRLIGFHPDSNLVKLAQFLDSNPNHKDNIQHAVWAISDKKNIASIANDNLGKQLRRLISSIQKIDTGWYTIEYFESNSIDSVFSDRHRHLSGNISFNTNYPSLITIMVKDARGQVIQFLENRYKSQGKHEYEIELDIKNWPKGKYELLIYEDQHVYVQKYNIEI